MIELVAPAEFLRRQRQEGLTLLDTRSPGEYLTGHIMGAKSLALFSDDERALVGTIYKQVDPRKALLEGLDIVGPKMRWLVEEAERLSEADFHLPAKPPIGLYCWRGGSRSASMAWLLETSGFAVTRLDGGYKAYRHHVRAFIDHLPFNFRVVDGSTGSGKTQFLHHLAEAGEQVLDLEGIAHHKGSAFGLTPGDQQPSNEAAENAIYAVLAGYDESRPVWVENESRNIGQVFLPDGIVNALAQGHRVELIVPLEDRLDHIVDEYGRYPAHVLADTFHRLRKRLGGEAAQRAVAAVDEGDLRLAATIALSYYDKAYAHYSERQAHPSAERHEVNLLDLRNLAEQLVEEARVGLG